MCVVSKPPTHLFVAFIQIRTNTALITDLEKEVDNQLYEEEKGIVGDYDKK